MAALPPLVCEPIYKPKPWGGREMAWVLGRDLPGDEPIGESWELVSLPGAESVIGAGALAGQTIASLLAGDRREGLLGGARLADGRFPLLIKFLDAREHLSVQVHPKPDPSDPDGWTPGIKHEAWCVIDAAPDAKMFIGLREGVTLDDVRAAANTPEIAELLAEWPARPGDCFYLPSGTPHALGAGVLVAEVQTPSDVTYRLYDWDRVGLDGEPRELHLTDGLANVRDDITPEMIAQPRPMRASLLGEAELLAACPRFEMERVTAPIGTHAVARSPRMEIWMILSGAGSLTTADGQFELPVGRTVLIGAATALRAVVAREPLALIRVVTPEQV